MSKPSTDLLINVEPTKELFVYMLTRDVQLRPAINDLVDNSTDGAKRLREDKPFKGLWVAITASADEFVIKDNCGGIPVDVAKDYAFRFGRPPGISPVPGSVGRFGVGMKRTLFKLGRRFRVVSTTSNSRFSVTVNVDHWLSKPDDWHFKFDKQPESLRNVDPEDQGTTITVDDLYDSVSQELANESFEGALRKDIASRQRNMIDRGLEIMVNGVPLHAEPLAILASPKLAPALKTIEFKKQGQKTVRVKIYCGLGEEGDRRTARAKAGWYVFCNGRLLLEADQSAITGWIGGNPIPGVASLPAFHPQYNLFRGYVFFDCSDPDRLPWNTTKTGINEDSDVYRSVRQQMATLARPVIAFLNQLKEEKEWAEERESDEPGPLQQLIAKAATVSPEEATTRAVFKIPTVTYSKPPVPAGPPMGRIQYSRPVTEINVLKKYFGVSSYVAVGERSFDEAFENAKS